MNHYRAAIEQLEYFSENQPDVVVKNLNDRTSRILESLHSTVSETQIGPEITKRDETLSQLWRRAWDLESTDEEVDILMNEINATQVRLYKFRFEGLDQLFDNLEVLLALAPKNALAKMSLREYFGEHSLNFLSLFGVFITVLNAIRIEIEKRRPVNSYQQEIARVADLLRFLETLEIIEHEYIPKLKEEMDRMNSDFDEIDGKVSEFTAHLERLESES